MTHWAIKRDFDIVPLTTENIEEATRLIHSVFPEEAAGETTPGDALRESLTGKPPDEKWGLRDLRYFLLIEKASGKIMGSTGLYTVSDEPKEMVWLGWFSIHPDYRGKRLGRFLLEWTVDESHRSGYTIIRLYTSRNPAEAVAQVLYEKMGFKVIDQEQEPEDTYEILYREKTF